MPSFDLRIITTPEDIPGCLISVNASNAANDATVVAGNVTEILNRAPASLRQFRNGDVLRNPYWNAVSEISAGHPTVDATKFSGFGGIVNPAGANFRMTTTVQFPAEVAAEFTCMFVVDYVPPIAASSVFEDGAGLVISLDNGAGNLAWSDAGAGAVGPACTSGPQQHLVLFGKATLIAAPTGDWRRNCAPLFSAAYTPTNFGNINTRIFGFAAHDFIGTAGRMLFYDRRLTMSEVDYLEAVVPPKFALLPSARTYLAPTAAAWTDPAGSGPGQVPRLNSVSGISERYLKVKRLAGQPVSLLLEATINGAVDVSQDFVAWFVEWPLQGSAPEPVVAQDGVLPGVCRLDLVADGHHLFELWRPGGGAVLVHFDVTSL